MASDKVTASSPGPAPGDLVYPLHEFDDSPVNRWMMHWTLRFDSILDTDKLQDALTYVLSQGDWRKMGGHLQLREDDHIEVHSPPEYTKERPPFQFSKEVYPMKTTDHPVAKFLPRASGKPELFPGGADQFNSLTLAPEWAFTFADHIRLREPIIGIRVALFEDATLVALRWAHVAADYMGIRGLLLAWSMAINKRYEDIPPLFGAYDDPFRDVGRAPTEPYVLADRQLSPQGYDKMMEHYIKDAEPLPITVRRTLVLPDYALRKIKRDFGANSSGASSADRVEITPKGALYNGQFISDGDILTAWATRLTAGLIPKGSERNVLVMSMFEARSCLPEHFPQRKDKPQLSPYFVHNATYSTYTNTTIKALREEPLVKTALLVREAVSSQTTAPQVHALLHRLRKVYASHRGQTAVFAADDSFVHLFSNFSKMLFYQSIDFTGAVVAPAAECHGAAPGKISWHQWHTLEHNHLHIRNTFQVGGKDARGNTWVMAALPPETFAVVEEHLASLSGEDGESQEDAGAGAGVGPSTVPTGRRRMPSKL